MGETEYNSIVEYYGEHEGVKCGYCKSPNTNFSHGMWAHMMTVSDYQDLIDRGWRRSGKYCYKPTMDMTCCPMYTIRCRSSEFKPSKSQKKILKRFNKCLPTSIDMAPSRGDCARKMSTCSSSDGDTEVACEGGDQFVESSREPQALDVNDVQIKSISNQAIKIDVNEKGPEMQLTPTASNSGDNHKQPVKKGTGPDLSKGPCKKAKQLRKEKKIEKLKEKGIDPATLTSNNKNKEKQVEDFLNELPEEFKNKLEIKLVRSNPPSAEYQATSKATHEVYVKYQMTIHGDRPEKCSESKFKQFLVSSPLMPEQTPSGPPCGYGSFHQQYWLEGKLIAVGVIDILPKCVSSVYFFYDPMYMHLTLGTYGALREIAFTRQLTSLVPELKYYYMGFYIHSCKKMRYKGNFHPSDLLCPETYEWFPLKDAIPLLEASPYSRLNPDIDAVDNNTAKESDINYIPMWYKSVVMPYKVYKAKHKGCDDELVEYANLVGLKTAKSLILVK